jgi:hypothetical protein
VDGSIHTVSRHDIDVRIGSNATPVMVDLCGASDLAKSDKLIVPTRSFHWCRRGALGHPDAPERAGESR